MHKQLWLSVDIYNLGHSELWMDIKKAIYMRNRERAHTDRTTRIKTTKSATQINLCQSQLSNHKTLES